MRLHPMLLIAILLGVAPTSHAQKAAPPVEDALFDKLRADLTRIDTGLQGVLGVAVKDLTTSRTIEIRGNVVFPQASAIKLALLDELYRQAGTGRVDLGALRPLSTARVGGSGIITHLSQKAQVTVRDLAVLMMALSDNTATNMLVDEVGGFEAINARMDALGLPKTRFRRKMIDLAAARRGEENVSTPLEMARLIEAIRDAAGLKPELAADLRAVAGVPKSTPFRDPLPEDVVVIDKPGELEGVRTATGAVLLKHRPYALAIMTAALQNAADGSAAIREISRLTYELFNRLDTSSPEGRLLGR